jgi:hypothetical protein
MWNPVIRFGGRRVTGGSDARPPIEVDYPAERIRMNANVTQPRRTLAAELDRLDRILDGLAEALNGAVADAVRAALADLIDGRHPEAARRPLAPGPDAPTAACWALVHAGLVAAAREVCRQAAAGPEACAHEEG